MKEAIIGDLNALHTLATELFDQAEAYRRSANALQSAGVRSDFSALPIFNLYAHAIELYLKAFLHSHGHPLEELDGKYRHDFRRIKKRAESYGLKFAGSDKVAMEYFIRTPLAIRLKYSPTPYYSVPTPDQLEGLCRTLRNHISTEAKGNA
jgi:hypothetical protein